MNNKSITTPTQREQVIHQYFEGVNQKNYHQIKNCFANQASITDICSLQNSSKRIVDSDTLAQRCMDFLNAHPDTIVKFHYPPTILRSCSDNDDDNSTSSSYQNWVFVHWYETGTWTGDSKGIKATGNKMEVEGQTRFHVNDESKITELVVTRTFTEWEESLQKQSIESSS